jgi:hypothetical protein
MFHAIQLVRDRQAEIVRTLSAADISFALSGSNATFAWIASVDESAVRQYRNVEFIINCKDINPVTSALEGLGLTTDVRDDNILFRNESIRYDRWTDIAFFAGEQIAGKPYRVPNLDRIEVIGESPLIVLDRLVSFQLSRWTLDDRVDLRDLMNVGLIDGSCIDRFPSHLSSRLI